MISHSYNIIIAGLGGQGVNTLTRTLFELSHELGLQCHGAIFKGGAQKAGSIRAELKIFTTTREDHQHFSNQILRGTLDLMLGLEPYEAMRYADFFHPGTRIIVDSQSAAFYSQRITGVRPPDAVVELKRVYPQVIARPYSRLAVLEHGDARASPLLMLLEAATTPGFPIPAEAIQPLMQTSRRVGTGTLNAPEGR